MKPGTPSLSTKLSTWCIHRNNTLENVCNFHEHEIKHNLQSPLNELQSFVWHVWWEIVRIFSTYRAWISSEIVNSATSHVLPKSTLIKSLLGVTENHSPCQLTESLSMQMKVSHPINFPCINPMAHWAVSGFLLSDTLSWIFCWCCSTNSNHLLLHGDSFWTNSMPRLRRIVNLCRFGKIFHLLHKKITWAPKKFFFHEIFHKSLAKNSWTTFIHI